MALLWSWIWEAFHETSRVLLTGLGGFGYRKKFWISTRFTFVSYTSIIMATKPEFGVSSSKFINKRGRGGGGHSLGSTRATTSFKQFGLPKGGGSNEQSNVDQRFEDVAILDALETRFGFERYQEGPQRLGWLLNMHEVCVEKEGEGRDQWVMSVSNDSSIDIDQRRRLAHWQIRRGLLLYQRQWRDIQDYVTLQSILFYRLQGTS